jgi:hypothetical protein
MECKYCGGTVRSLGPNGMVHYPTQCDNCGRINCEKEIEDDKE